MFGPRFGFAYQLLKGTVLRGGYGVYYAPTTGNFVRLGQSGFARDSDMVTSLDGGFTPAGSLSNPFPNGIQQPLGAAAGPSAAIGVNAEGNVRSLSIPYAQQWNFNVQQQFLGNWILEVGYAEIVEFICRPTAPTISASAVLLAGAQLQQLVPNPYFGIITTGNLSAQNVQRGTLLDTFPQFLGAGTIDHWASSIYHAMMVRAEKRFAGGLALIVSYAWTKTLDDNAGNGLNAFWNGGNNGVQDWNNLRTERAVSTINLPHRIVITPLWALPFGKSGGKLTRAFIGGWQIGGILNLQSGEPIGITQNGVAYGGNRPNVVGDPNAIQNQSIDRWFNTDAFAVIQPFTFGNAPRNQPNTRTDSLFNLDFSVLKDIPITERVRTQFRAEAFNLTNTVTFGNPGTNRSATNFVSSPATPPITTRAVFNWP